MQGWIVLLILALLALAGGNGRPCTLPEDG